MRKTNNEKDYGEWWRTQQDERVDAVVSIGGITLNVSRGVFSPDPTTTYSVMQFLEDFPDVKGKRVLEIGTGSGILAIKAALSGASEVVATDIDEAALKDAHRNIHSLGVQNIVKLLNEDNFEILGQFDVVLMNIIFAHSPKTQEAWDDNKSDALRLHRRLLNNFTALVGENGAAYLGFASFGDIQGLEKLLSTSGLACTYNQREVFGVNWYNIKVMRPNIL